MSIPVKIVDLWAMFLWCHAAVLVVSWFRVVGRTDRRDHVGHFISLMGELVPMAAGVILLIFAGSVLGLPSVVVFLAVVFPAGLVFALLMEVERVGETSRQSETRRLASALGLTCLVYTYRSLV